jgi:small-conductance mechanosensitive channel
LALSLGARPYIENILGGVALFINRSIQIGDYCEFGGVQGTVEDIGLRSTKLRTLDRTLITVPNIEASISKVVNYSRRDKCRRDKYRVELPLRLAADAVRDRFEAVVNSIETLLGTFSYVQQDVEIRLVNLDAVPLLPLPSSSALSEQSPPPSSPVVPTLELCIIIYLRAQSSRESFVLRREVLLKLEQHLQALGVERY